MLTAVLQRLARKLLGLEDAPALLAGLRADHGAHAAALTSTNETLGKAVGLLQQTQAVAMSAHSRLHYYEQHVVPIRHASQSLRERMAGAQRRAEAAARLAAGAPIEAASDVAELAPPEMSEDVAGA